MKNIYTIIIFLLVSSFLYANKPDIVWTKTLKETGLPQHIINNAVGFDLYRDADTLFLPYVSDLNNYVGAAKLDTECNVFDYFNVENNIEHIFSSANIQNLIINDRYYHFYMMETNIGSRVFSKKITHFGDLIGTFPKDTNQKMGVINADFDYIYNDTLYMPSLGAAKDEKGEIKQIIFFEVFDEDLDSVKTLRLDSNQINYRVSQPFLLYNYTNYRFIMPVYGPERLDRQYSIFCKTDRNLNVLYQKKVKIPGYYGFYHERNIFDRRNGKLYCMGTVTEKDTLGGNKCNFVLDTNFNLLSYKIWDNEFINYLPYSRRTPIKSINKGKNFLYYGYKIENFDTDDGKVPYAMMLLDNEGNVLQTYEWSLNDGEHDKILKIFELKNNEFLAFTNSKSFIKFKLPLSSIEDNKTDDEVITISPNPASDHITVNIDDEIFKNKLECSIISQNGYEVLKFTMNSAGKTIPVDNLSSGVYFLQIKGLYESSIAIKFVVRK